MAIIRHHYDPNDRSIQPFERVANEREFSQFMETYKATTKEWQSLECIQSCIKTKSGLGKYIPIHFRMEVDITAESKIEEEMNNTASMIKQAPPLLKYDY